MSRRVLTNVSMAMQFAALVAFCVGCIFDSQVMRDASIFWMICGTNVNMMACTKGSD